MRRDFDLVRRILEVVEASDNVSGYTEWLVERVGHNGVEDASADEIAYNFKQAVLAELIDVSANYLSATNGNFELRFKTLTPAGHDFLDATRDSGVWERTKAKIAEEGGSASLELVKSLALAYTKKKIEDRTGLTL